MTDDNKQKIIDEYETKKAYYDNLRDEVTNLEKTINDVKQTIINTISFQERIKQNNYNIWSQLEEKELQPKTTEKEPDITDILGSFK